MAQKLGVKYIKSNSGKIKDVSGKIINNLGKCEKLRFKVEGIKPTFEIQPNILESMNDHVNLGSAFLQKNNTNIRLTRNGNFLKFNRLKPVQMVNSIKDSQIEQKSIKTSKKEEAKSMNDGKGKLICKHRVLLKPRCVTFINICSETQRKEIVTEPLNDTALCQVLPALYKNPKKVAVINESNEDVWLQKGSHIGHFENGTKVKYELPPPARQLLRNTYGLPVQQKIWISSDLDPLQDFRYYHILCECVVHSAVEKYHTKQTFIA